MPRVNNYICHVFKRLQVFTVKRLAKAGFLPYCASIMPVQTRAKVTFRIKRNLVDRLKRQARKRGVYLYYLLEQTLDFQLTQLEREWDAQQAAFAPKPEVAEIHS